MRIQRSVGTVGTSCRQSVTTDKETKRGKRYHLILMTTTDADTSEEVGDVDRWFRHSILILCTCSDTDSFYLIHCFHTFSNLRLQCTVGLPFVLFSCIHFKSVQIKGCPDWCSILYSNQHAAIQFQFGWDVESDTD